MSLTLYTASTSENSDMTNASSPEVTITDDRNKSKVAPMIQEQSDLLTGESKYIMLNYSNTKILRFIVRVDTAGMPITTFKLHCCNEKSNYSIEFTKQHYEQLIAHAKAIAYALEERREQLIYHDGHFAIFTEKLFYINLLEPPVALVIRGSHVSGCNGFPYIYMMQKTFSQILAQSEDIKDEYEQILGKLKTVAHMLLSSQTLASFFSESGRGNLEKLVKFSDTLPISSEFDLEDEEYKAECYTPSWNDPPPYYLQLKK